MQRGALDRGRSKRRQRARAGSSVRRVFGGRGLLQEGDGERFGNGRIVSLHEFIVDFSTEVVKSDVARYAEHDDIVLVHGLDGQRREIAARRR